MISRAANINRLWADLLVEELIRTGVEYFCIAPGSRSAPLVTAVADNARARHLVHFDERGVAFHALGYGRATGRPAACITTSGSAVANAFPAVVEADADSVPLLLLTADRPPELRSAGANQTIDQVKIFGSRVRWFVDLPAPEPSIDPSFILTTIDQAVRRSCSQNPGPVHLNCMFREPLAPDADGTEFPRVDDHVASWHRSGRPFTSYEGGPVAPGQDQISEFARLVHSVDRGIVVVGRLPAWTDPEIVLDLCEVLRWPLLADVASQLRSNASSSALVKYPSLILSDEAMRGRLRPDCIVHLGGPLVSKRLSQFIEGSGAIPYVMASAVPTRLDPAHRVTHRFECDPIDLYRAAAVHIEASSGDYLSAWKAADHAASEALGSVLGTLSSLAEPGIGAALGACAPEAGGLFLGSSLPVRDVDTFGGVGLPSRVGANRGASGIDGSIASAAGFAVGLGRPVVAVVGDLALLHDLNSLALARNLDQPLCIIVINNDGGGIFSFLPIARHPKVFEPFFGTPHGLTFEHAASLFGLPHSKAGTLEELNDRVRDALTHKGATLVEVAIDRTANVAIHHQIESAIAERFS